VADLGVFNSIGPCKIYIVDDRDPDREKVIEVRSMGVTIEVDNSGLNDLRIDSLLDSVKIFRGSAPIYKLKNVVLHPFEDGTLVRLNNFNEPVEEEYDDDYAHDED
jgi:hypothetical protein